MTALPSLTLGHHTVPYPIIQGGMGIRISGAKLAGAVANTGGVGIISAVGLGWNSPYFDPAEKSPKQRWQQFYEANRLALIDELKKARAISPDGVIGINLMVAARQWEVLAETAAEHGANLIIAGAGLPLSLPAHTANHPEVALVPIVSSVRAAQVICRRWQRQYNRLPDGFVVENPQAAGGHLGASEAEMNDPAFALEQVIPALVEFAQGFDHPMAIIAAGGIWDRADIDWALRLGASGVQLGTRFITTQECDAHPHYKTYHLQSCSRDVTLVPSPVGLPGRALRNPFVEKALDDTTDLSEPCVANCLQVCKCRENRDTYCILKALTRAATGDVENGLIFSGSNAGRAHELVSVADLMAELVASPRLPQAARPIPQTIGQA